MTCHVQIVVGVLGEVEEGKSGTILVQKEIAKDSELVGVCRKLLLAEVGVFYWIIPHMFSPQPLLID